MQRSGRRESLELVSQEGAIAVEPSLRLEEREEEQSRGGEQRDRAAVGGVGTAAGGAGEGRDRRLEVAIESPRERVAAEQLAPAEVLQRFVPPVVRRREDRERLGVGLAQVGGFDDQRRERAARLGGRRGDEQLAACRLTRDDEPVQSRRLVREPPRDRDDPLAEWRALVPVEQQGAERSAPSRDPDARTVVGEAEAREFARRERERLGEAERRGQRGERRPMAGRGEQARGITSGEHARMVSPIARGRRITSLPVASRCRARPRCARANGPGAPSPTARG